MIVDQGTQLTSEQFEKLIRLYEQRYILCANNIVRDIEVARDLVYDCFAKVWEQRETIENRNVCGLIFTMVHNSAISYRRTAMRGQQIFDKIRTKERGMSDYYMTTLESSNPEELFQSELLEIYEKELALLPQLSRNIFVASRIHGKTYKEIAAQLDIPVKRVDREIQRIVILLRRSLRDYLITVTIFCIPFI